MATHYPIKLNPCKTCGLKSDQLLWEYEVVAHSQVPHVQCFIRCGCRTHVGHVSPEEAARAWNGTNPVAK